MVCRICGSGNVPEAVFCENCGGRLHDAMPRNPGAIRYGRVYPVGKVTKDIMYDYSEAPKASKKKILLTTLLIIVAMIVCGVGSYYGVIYLLS